MAILYLQSVLIIGLTVYVAATLFAIIKCKFELKKIN